MTNQPKEKWEERLDQTQLLTHGTACYVDNSGKQQCFCRAQNLKDFIRTVIIPEARKEGYEEGLAAYDDAICEGIKLSRIQTLKEVEEIIKEYFRGLIYIPYPQRTESSLLEAVFTKLQKNYLINLLEEDFQKTINSIQEKESKEDNK